MVRPVVHQAPEEWAHVTGCCGLPPAELATPYRLDPDPTRVTCRGQRAALEQARMLVVGCPTCHVPAGVPCLGVPGIHIARAVDAMRAGQ